MSNKNIRIKLGSFNYRSLNRAVQEIVSATLRTGATVIGPIPLPTVKNRQIVLRSPHIDKKSREQFELQKHFRVMYIDPNPQTIDALGKLEIEAGVDVHIKL